MGHSPGSLWERYRAPFLRTHRVPPAAAALARYLRAEGSSVDLLHVEVAYPHGTAAALARRMSGWRGPMVLTPMGEDILVREQSSYGFSTVSRAP